VDSFHESNDGHIGQQFREEIEKKMESFRSRPHARPPRLCRLRSRVPGNAEAAAESGNRKKDTRSRN
jgi:RNA processing factor Prp31